MNSKLALPTLLIVCLLAACHLNPGQTPTPPPADEQPGAVTDTPAVTLTASQTPPPTFTFTPEIVTISVSMDTNCRTGPGQVYDMVSGLMVGETAQVFGTDPTGKYWYIANPHGTGFCWVWGEYATLTGDTTLLPVFTPPPTPTPTPVVDFQLTFVALDSCMAMRYTRLKIINIGVVGWESFKATITDVTTGDVSSPMEADEFTDATSCAENGSVAKLGTGESAIVYTYGFDHDLPGHSLKAEVTVCSLDGLVGTCVSHTISFVP
jgi:hypothetical protein